MTHLFNFKACIFILIYLFWSSVILSLIYFISVLLYWENASVHVKTQFTSVGLSCNSVFERQGEPVSSSACG